MARENFLAGLGAALSTASDLTQRNRQERRQQDLDKQAREMELARMALSRDNFALDQKAFQASQTRDARTFAKDILEEGGPGAILDEAGAAALDAGGFGHRKSEPTFRIGPETQGAEVAPTQSILPTGDQKFQIEQRANQERERAALEERRNRARMAMDNEGFYKMPELQRATVWQDAGYSGQAPMSMDEWKAREEYQLQNQLKVVGAQGANQIAAANVRADAAEELLRQRLAGTAAKPTGAQTKSVGYYNRLRESAQEIDKYESQLNDNDVWIMNNSPVWEWINNKALSSAGKAYAQSMRKWTEARLRQESGAAIAQGEYDTDRRTIGRQTGDDANLLTQKKKSRTDLLDSFGYSSGPAFQEFYGKPFQKGVHTDDEAVVPAPGGAQLPGGGLDCSQRDANGKPFCR